MFEKQNPAKIPNSRSILFLKSFAIIMVSLLIFGPLLSGIGAAATTPAQAEIRVIIGDQPIRLEVSPIVRDGRTLVPMRGFFEALGASVTWDPNTRTATGVRGQIEVRIPIGSQEPTVNGQVKRIDVAALTIDGRTYIPLRFVGEALGDSVRWDNATRSIFITKQQPEQPPAEPPVQPPAQPPAQPPVTGPAMDPRDKGYAGVRQIRNENGELLLTLEPNEMLIFVTNERTIDRGAMEVTEAQETAGITGRDLLRERLLGQYIREVFPGLKFRIVAWDEGGLRERHFRLSNVYPDLILDQINRQTTRAIKENDMQFDLTPLIREHNLDLSPICPASMATARDRGGHELYSIPFQINHFILFYNKHWFNVRNIPYPTAGMTYDQAFLKARQLTWQEGTRVVKGYFAHPDHYINWNQRGLNPFSQTEPDRVVINTPEWRNLTENLARFYRIPSNIWTTTDDFWTRGDVAMVVDHMERLFQASLIKDYLGPTDHATWATRLANTNPRLDRPGEAWDIAPVPVLYQGSQTTYRPNTLGWFIPRQSEMKHTAFQIIEHLVSHDVQLRRAKDGMKGVIHTDEIAKAFGSNIPEFKNLNLSAVYWGNPAVQQVRPPEIVGEGFWDIPLWQVFRQFILRDGMTPDAAIERAEREFNAWITNRKAAGGRW